MSELLSFCAIVEIEHTLALHKQASLLILLVLSDLVGVDQLTIVIPTKMGIQLCLSGGSPPTRG